MSEDGEVVTPLMRYMKNKKEVKVEVSCYNKSLKVETFIDSLSKMGCYFKFKRMEDSQRMKLTRTKLKRDTAIWCALVIA